MSSKKSKEVDEISRETQRLVKDSHVRLPYHKPKQKSLKDFLNRQKITSEYQASITGSKKLLQKAWELIENKEQNVEKFYNEDCSYDDDNKELTSSNGNMQTEKNIALESDDDTSCDKEFVLKEKDDMSSEEDDVDDENEENSLIIKNDGKLSTNDAISLFNDEEENSMEESSECSDQYSPQKNLVQEYNEDNSSTDNFEDDDTDGKNSINSKNGSKKSVVNQFFDDEAELSELDHSSDGEENLSNLNDESEKEDEEEFSKKKRKLVVLSDSDDDDNDDAGNSDDNNVLNPGIKLTSNNLMPFGNEVENNFSTQQLLGFCSGQFETQNPKTQKENNQIDFEDDFDSDVPLDDADSTTSEDERAALKLTSAKDYFDDEAELSESDWSSDDEEHLAIDKLEEEAGDQDKLDEDIVKDGLDKIYMRQLLDDDQQQVTALKEMLLEDGDLHSDFNRKRKFQWDEVDENDAAFKKPLFSDNEDDDENDEALSDDGKAEQWRKERFKRESYLSQKNSSDDEEQMTENNESSDILQSSISVVKKTHIVKYGKCETKKGSNANVSENNEESVQLSRESNLVNDNKCLVTVITDTTKINSGGLNPINSVLTKKSNKFVKGSFMNRKGDNKLANTLLYINKKSVVLNNDETNNKHCEIKALTTITAKATSNPFAYLMRSDTKEEIKSLNPDDLMIERKKENIHLNKSCISVQSTQQASQIKHRKPIKSILKQLEL